MTAPAAATGTSFTSATAGVGKFALAGKTLLIPSMAPFASRLLAASFRAFGVNAEVMETYRGMDLGRESTSGKECFPCQVTLGDILWHLRKEKDRLGTDFSPGDYVYFLPEAGGPCRFGMYTRMQRLALDRFDNLRDVKIAYLSTSDAYAAGGLLPAEEMSRFRKLGWVATVAADVLDRIAWRVRPYEAIPGSTDAYLALALASLERTVIAAAPTLDFSLIHDEVELIARGAVPLMDPAQPRRPLIGVVGEIYLRTHPDSNQEVVRQIERFGGEAIVSSMAEWINFISHETATRLRRETATALRKRDWKGLRASLSAWAAQAAEKRYLAWRQAQVYARALRHLSICEDHAVAEIERFLDDDRHFTFDIGTEACLSIGGALAYAHHGARGVVNVFPFSCMPSSIASSILTPLFQAMEFPYQDVSCDGTTQPNREAALRTFIYQASQSTHR